MAETSEDFAVHRLIRDLFDDLSLTLPSLGCSFEGLVAPSALTAQGAAQTLRNKLFLLIADLAAGVPRLTVRFEPSKSGSELTLGFVCTPFHPAPHTLPRWDANLFTVLAEDKGPGFQLSLPAGQPLQVGPPVDWKELGHRYGGEAQGRQLLDLFLARVVVLMDDLQACIGASDAPGVLRAAHTLKGSARGVTARALAEASLQLEMAGRSGVLTEARDLYKALRVTYDEFILCVRAGQP
jgi:HPt (histidine-containing phosphotransfer) domain-containing protein